MAELQTSAQGVGPAAEFSRSILESRPQLTPGANIVWEAFGELFIDRPPAMSGMTSIPFAAILQYADYAEMTRTDREIFVQQIRILDNILVSKRNAAAAKSSK